MKLFLIVMLLVLVLPIAYIEYDSYQQRKEERQGKGRYDG